MARIRPFEQYSLQYEAWFEKHRFSYQSELLAVKQLIPLKGKGIEIGVGSGHFAASLDILFVIEPLKDIKRTESAKKGYGEGSFVVIKGEK